jgi:hypothetical protein
LGNVPRIAKRPAENITVDIADISDSTALLRKNAAGKIDMTTFIVRVTGVAPSSISQTSWDSSTRTCSRLGPVHSTSMGVCTACEIAAPTKRGQESSGATEW